MGYILPIPHEYYYLIKVPIGYAEGIHFLLFLILFFLGKRLLPIDAVIVISAHYFSIILGRVMSLAEPSRH